MWVAWQDQSSAITNNKLLRQMRKEPEKTPSNKRLTFPHVGGI